MGMGGGEEFDYFAAMMQFNSFATTNKVEDHLFSCSVLVSVEEK